MDAAFALPAGLFFGSLALLALSASPPASASGRAAQEDDARAAALETAGAALERGDAVAAERAFVELLVADPDLEDALVGRAAALERLGRGEEGVAAIVRAADRRLRRGADAEAVSLLERATARLAPDARLFTSLGEALLRARRFVAAETALEKAAALVPGSSRTQHLLAAASWENGRLDEAERIYRSLVDAAPDDAEAWFQLGRLLAWQARASAALTAFDRARRLGRDDAELLLETARALDAASRESPAEHDAEAVARAYAAAVSAAPDDYQARHGWARALERAGEHQAAARERAEFERLYHEHQEHTRLAGLDRARLDRARADLRDGDAEGAVRALHGSAPTADVHRIRALALLELGDPAAARRELEAAVRLAPERTDLRALLGQLRSSADG